jgi:RNA polymerase sigma-70 factor (ECF subfamily)
MDSHTDPLLSSCPGASRAEDLEASMALFARARLGDRAALGELVSRHHEELLRVVRIRLGAGMRRFLESGDIVQETYQALVEDIAKVDLADAADLVQWLARVATNRIRDQHDRAYAQKRDPAREEALNASATSACAPSDRLTADDTEPPERAMRNEIRAVLDEAVAALSPEYREAIVLRDFCGASWEHVARALNRDSIHAAQQLHQRAWIKVRKLAEPRLGGGEGEA